jgi:CRISPR-associated protein Csa1
MILRDADIDKRIMFLRKRMTPIKIRGWNWESPPVKPAINIGLGISELVSRYCTTMRDIYLRRVLGKKPKPNALMTRGVAYHNIISRVYTDAKRVIFRMGIVQGSVLLEELMNMAGSSSREIAASSGLDDTLTEELESLYKFFAIQIAAEIDRNLSKHPYIELDSLIYRSLPVTERVVDGSLLGLGKQLKVDLLSEGGIIIDIKTGDRRDFHRLGLAGYALALEADSGIPADIGILAYLKVNGRPQVSYDIFELSDELRMEFLSLRDEATSIVSNEEDPGMPPECSELCPFHGVCHEEKDSDI